MLQLIKVGIQENKKITVYNGENTIHLIFIQKDENKN
jgi:hypothetical protein